jgi:hypothetical protein
MNWLNDSGQSLRLRDSNSVVELFATTAITLLCTGGISFYVRLGSGEESIPEPRQRERPVPRAAWGVARLNNREGNSRSIQKEVSAEQLAERFHHYDHALRADHNRASEHDTEAWEEIPHHERIRLVAAARWYCWI